MKDFYLDLRRRQSVLKAMVSDYVTRIYKIHLRLYQWNEVAELYNEAFKNGYDYGYQDGVGERTWMNDIEKKIKTEMNRKSGAQSRVTF